MQVLPSFFNPSNDMALAANVRQYLPPRRIQQMEADLVDLAKMWENTRFAGPWGWSLATKQRYRQMGLAEGLLPSDEWLAQLRGLSSREFACRYIKDLLAEIADERLLGSEMRWMDRLCVEPGTRIFKSPWSSSGRGVFVSSSCDDHTESRLRGFLSSQGGFVVDRFYADKVLDFAMEFFVDDDHTVDFLGWSVFHAAEHGAYGYNYVESQEELLRRIDVDASLLQRLVDYHKVHLSQTSYRGPVGIDMLKTTDGRIHPCLEINFRLNMGILALLLHERYGAGCTKQLTPLNPNGFEALVERGKLMVVYRKR
jgi:hypothetical protein